MKKLYILTLIVLLICVVGTVVFLIISPDQVPVHYNLAGEADRIGSKYENLLFPAFAVVMGAFFVIIARRESKKSDKSNEKVLMICGLFSLIFFTLIGFYFMLKALRYDPEVAPAVSVDDVNRFVNIGIGVLLIVLGNIMPKARRNSLVGIRTKWSMASDAVWQKSQRFGGIVLVIAGFVMIVLSLIVPGIWNVLVLTTVIAAAAILSAAASRRYYLEEKESSAK